MSLLQYGDIIANIVQPNVIDNVVTAKTDKLFNLYTRNTDVRSGARITESNIVGETYNGGAFTRADANSDSMTQTFANPYWNKKYYQETATIRREDIDEAREGTPLVGLLNDAAMKVAKGVMSHGFTGMMTQLKADIDSAATYSDAAILRATIGASYEENTDAAITLAYLRAAQDATGLKDEIDWNDYVWLLEQAVLNTAGPLMNATGSWGVRLPTGQSTSGLNTGYDTVNKFDNILVDTTYGMTTGDCFLTNRNDVQIQEHKPFELEIKMSDDQYAYEVVGRWGVNLWVRRPKFAAKMTLKD